MLKCLEIFSKKNILTRVQGATRRQRRGGIDGEPTSNGSSAAHHTKKLRFQLAKERKASTTLGIIMSAFTVCWLPFFVLALVRPFLTSSDSIPSSLSRYERACVSGQNDFWKTFVERHLVTLSFAVSLDGLYLFILPNIMDTKPRHKKILMSPFCLLF